MNLTDLIGPTENANPKSSRSRKAILWGEDDLLAQGMESFLAAAQAWEVIRIPADQGIPALVAQVRRTRPDLLIIYQGKSDDSDPLVKLLLEQPEFGMIADQLALKVIAINLESNRVQVYSKRSVTVRKSSDLLSIIEDGYFLDHEVNDKEVDKDRSMDGPSQRKGRQEFHKS